MIFLGNKNLSLNHLKKIILKNEIIAIEKNAIKHIDSMYKLIEAKANSKELLYGINTGFGALAEKKISLSDQKILQRNIIISHAVGVGACLRPHEARAMMLLRLNTLAKGYSGASSALLNAITILINNNIAPYVPKKGSVGASGDLAPLAHLGLLLLGIGQAFYKGNLISAKEALKKAKLSPFNLGLRDGLALINGTQAMGAKAIIAIFESDFLMNLADIAAASSLEALCAHMTPFDKRIQEIKAHPGQIKTAKNIRKLLKKPHHFRITNLRTQDPYSLRCIPQVHGASKDVIEQMTAVIEREINGVTDNPLIFKENNDIAILSGGNFHGQSLAMALDYMALAIAELANISERRIEQLLNPVHNNGLPPFLIDNSGLNSGYMMLHVTASSLVNENKILAHPASTDSIPTSANREDHVSMGMTSANKLSEIIENTLTVLAIELMAAHQALEFRKDYKIAIKMQKINSALRATIPFRKQDGLFFKDLEKMLLWLKTPQTAKLFDDLLE